VKPPSTELAPPLKLNDDFSNDPCGDPRRESTWWSPVEGKVARVIDGDTISVSLTARSRLLVHLVGVDSPALDLQFEREAQLFLETNLLGKRVEVLVNPSNWLFKKPRPQEVTGVVYVVGSSRQDVGLSLIAAGLGRHKQPARYSMSGYTRCQYERAEEKARAARLGLWRGTA
jgi:endonuclease YncB( thermonuclease family)